MSCEDDIFSWNWPLATALKHVHDIRIKNRANELLKTEKNPHHQLFASCLLHAQGRAHKAHLKIRANELLKTRKAKHDQKLA